MVGAWKDLIFTLYMAFHYVCIITCTGDQNDKNCARVQLCAAFVLLQIYVFFFFIYILSNNQIICEYLAGLCTLLVVYCFKITNFSSERIHNSMHRHIKLYYLCTLICDMCQHIYLRFHEQNFRNLCKCECMQVKQNACDWEGRRTKLFK